MSNPHAEKLAYMSATPMQREVVITSLLKVLGVLRAQAISYQTSHWQAGGDAAYGNHLLFERLYGVVVPEVDGVAEKMVGYFGAGALSIEAQSAWISRYCDAWGQIECPFGRGLKSEEDFQACVKDAYNKIKQVQAMTLGLDDWLMAIANTHETHTYLLQQVKAGKTPKTASYKPKVGDRVQLRDGRKTGVVVEVGELPFLPNSVKIRLDNGPTVGRDPSQLLKRAGTPLPVAPSAEDAFFDNPEKREVREFAETDAVSNDPEVAAEASGEDQLDLPEAEAVSEAREAPPTPEEIVEEPGGDQVSTLNRYVVHSEEPGVEKSLHMAGWLEELDRS